MTRRADTPPRGARGPHQPVGTNIQTESKGKHEASAEWPPTMRVVPAAMIARRVIHPSIEIIPLAGLPEIAPADDLSRLIAEAVKSQDLRISEGDIFVVAQKIVSKAEGKIVRLDSIQPSKRAEQWAAQYQKDARVIELVLSEASRIVRMERGVIVAETRHGFVCANAGVDVSNAPEETAILFGRCRPLRARAANTTHEGFRRPRGRHHRRHLWASLAGRAGQRRAGRGGDRAAGGLSWHARRQRENAAGDSDCQGDELAAAAGLVMGKADRVPVAILRGVASGEESGSGRDLIRPAATDIFR